MISKRYFSLKAKNILHPYKSNTNPVLNFAEYPKIRKLIEDVESVTQDCSQSSNDTSSIETAHMVNLKHKQIFEELYHSQLQSVDRTINYNPLFQSHIFDKFLQTKFPTFKRYSLEGNDSMILLLDALFAKSVDIGYSHSVLGMAHRGRLNTLAYLGYDVRELFRKINKGKITPAEWTDVGCDVGSHISISAELKFKNRGLKVSMVHNPSHLELVNPVSMGKAYSKMKHGGPEGLLNVFVHGDAALAGQGTNYEMLQFHRHRNYSVNGSIHVVANNQIGFTSELENQCSSYFPTDIFKAFDIPVIHVNTQDLQAVVKSIETALQYKHQTNESAVVNLIGYRHYGHNEMDDVNYTNRKFYKHVKQLKDIVAVTLEQQPALTKRYEKLKEKVFEHLNKSLEDTSFKIDEMSYTSPSDSDTNTDKFKYVTSKAFTEQWSNMKPVFRSQQVDMASGIALTEVETHIKNSIKVEDHFNLYKFLVNSVVNKRKQMLESRMLDWPTAEAVAVGSLLQDGFNVRLAGQDSKRGTFSQRHFAFIDDVGAEYIPLNQGGYTGELEVISSNLSEEGVMAFEYGMSIDNPKNCVIWEAQYGDFANKAQAVIDNFIFGSFSKWCRQSSLMLLLPHGFDHTGPEHVSGRVERFLQLSWYNDHGASDPQDQQGSSSQATDMNSYVYWPSTPANYFHLLKRQMIRDFRVPAVVFVGKMLLRLPECKSNFEEIGPHSKFQPIIFTTNKLAQNKKLIICNGMMYYHLIKWMEESGLNIETSPVDILRIEQLCPFPVQELLGVPLSTYESVSFLQEEPRNQGAYLYVQDRLNFHSMPVNCHYIGRKSTPCTTTGGVNESIKELEQIKQQTIKLFSTRI